MTKHNKYFYESGRNGWTPSSTINPKMFISKEEIEMMKKTKYNFNWQLDKVSEKIVNLLKEKNSAYGNTALNPPNIFSKLDSTEAICARLDDKLSRIKNRGINDKTEDTIDDIIGYLLLLKITNFQLKLEKIIIKKISKI